jgi:hypothetical protein
MSHENSPTLREIKVQLEEITETPRAGVSICADLYVRQCGLAKAMERACADYNEALDSREKVTPPAEVEFLEALVDAIRKRTATACDPIESEFEGQPVALFESVNTEVPGEDDDAEIVENLLKQLEWRRRETHRTVVILELRRLGTDLSRNQAAFAEVIQGALKEDKLDLYPLAGIVRTSQNKCQEVLQIFHRKKYSDTDGGAIFGG